MFACLARISLEVPVSGSLKIKRQLVRRVTDRVKARFNVAVAEVDDSDSAERCVIGLSVIGSERRVVAEQMEKIAQYIEGLYVAPVVSTEKEVVIFGDAASSNSGLGDFQHLVIPKGERSLAEAEGLGEWEARPPPAKPTAPMRRGTAKAAAAASNVKLSLDDARAAARRLRNKRDWENKG